MLSFGKTARRLIAIMLFWFCAQPLRAQTQPIQYYYDDLGRLVTVVDQSGNVVTYNYDAVGNILSIGRSTVKLGSLAIFDFNPETGPTSTVVTIQGQGFSANASSDTVKFNGVTATVTSATTTSLVASVPVGATTGPISVMVGSNTATSAGPFTISQAPAIVSVAPKSALFNIVISDFTVTGANLLGATFSFSSSPPGPTINAVSINPNGTSASMTVSAAMVEGTFALVATTSAGSTGAGTTEANRFTVVNPNSTAISACGVADVIEAAYGLDPLNPKSCPTGPLPTSLLPGEVDGPAFSLLNTVSPAPPGPTAMETDSLAYSLLNSTDPAPPGPTAMETDSLTYSLLNSTDPAPPGPTATEADSLTYSLLNSAGEVLRKHSTESVPLRNAVSAAAGDLQPNAAARNQQVPAHKDPGRIP